MSSNTRLVIGLGVIGVALYLYLKPEARFAVETAATRTQAALDAAAAQIAAQAAARDATAQQKTQRIVGTLLGTASTVAGLWTSGVIGGSSAAAATTTGTVGTVGAAGAGIGTAATIAITGGIAGGAVLAWGIISKGWFRGGWEGIKGNELRNQFTQPFIDVYYPGGGIEMQYEAMVEALAAVGIVGSGEPGSSVPSAGELIEQLYAADEPDEMREVFARWQTELAKRGLRVAVPEF